MILDGYAEGVSKRLNEESKGTDSNQRKGYGSPSGLCLPRHLMGYPQASSFILGRRSSTASERTQRRLGFQFHPPGVSCHRLFLTSLAAVRLAVGTACPMNKARI